jgi:hypothetical protein
MVLEARTSSLVLHGRLTTKLKVTISFWSSNLI